MFIKLKFIFLAVYEREQVLLNIAAKEILQLYSTGLAKDAHSTRTHLVLYSVEKYQQLQKTRQMDGHSFHGIILARIGF